MFARRLLSRPTSTSPVICLLRPSTAAAAAAPRFATPATTFLTRATMSNSAPTAASAAATTTTPRQPAWHQPAPKAEVPVLKIYNSLTRQKEVFTPANGRQVTWYNCGPTVYDAAHIGHARLYMTVDVLRRVLEEYFGYDVLLVMNITDIDDKIILRARQTYLFDQFRKQHVESGKGLTDDVREQVTELWKTYVARTFGDAAAHAWPKFYTKAVTEQTGDLVVDAKRVLKLKQAAAAYDALQQHVKVQSVEALETVLAASRDIIATALDVNLGHTVTDQQVFRDFAAFWEDDFLKDMDGLGVRAPDVLTRVSEFVPEIITFVEQIVANGYAYEADGSVYFDTRAFHANPNHHYAKLEPWSVNSEALLAEGEGDLSTNLTHRKRAPADFALWKKSKTGEPFWPSPWGNGRPGWHIECSVMASAVTGTQLDLHSGGIDLAFPHHDNEIAQSEAHFGCDQWVNYFMHVGHLHVEGQKMSKSLKNFFSVKDALQQYKPSTLRMMYLQQHWQGGMDFKAATAQEAMAAEATLRNFATNVRALLADYRANPPPFTGAHDFRKDEADLLAHLQASQGRVHAALCDNLHTPAAMDALLDLVSKTNVYLRNVEAAKQHANAYLVAKVAKYVTRMTKIFGLTEQGAEIGYGFPESDADSAAAGGASRDELVLPYVQALSKFRDDVRAAARTGGNDLATTVLKLSDQVRDDVLPDLGVALDDRDGGRALVKLVDPAQLRAERAEKKAREAAKLAAKAEAARKAAVKKLERLYKGRVAPKDLFKGDEYGKSDADGVPTHDAKGEELPKARRKKLAKEFDAQRKLHDEYLAATKEGPIDWAPLRDEYAAKGEKLDV
ncbi:cysteine-tRNA ligase [Allomyces macrogynus ATCC 38327]|uniref:cysteine--tRNA ligase n=1 Tax=Allomyces macrogynus (strain ATCC 38327) TaxID=578462 RepID=A0A0L0SC59_ALLM3|nr:cysteine-tRNA ligase [Allomyces macrogynus ATCC 38327]|eukprot:KNE59999.1 cysteine-tRNA ligase [Allomyces macrogynus ATCC 38327]